MTFAEIGRRLGISQGRAWWLYFNGLRKLRRSGKLNGAANVTSLRTTGGGAPELGGRTLGSQRVSRPREGREGRTARTRPARS
jgi:hypothetical protein